MLILNERKHAEEIIRSGDTGKHPVSSLWTVTKFCRANGLTKSATQAFLADIVRLHLPNMQDDLNPRLQQIVTRAWDVPLVEADHLEVYASEMDKIDALPSRQIRRLAFTLLIVGKYALDAKRASAAWVNLPDSELFALANVKVGKNARGLLLNDLYKLGMVRFGGAVDSTGIEVLFIERQGSPVLKVTVMREIGAQYDAYHNPSRYRRCAVCGLPVLAKKVSGVTAYCDAHSDRASKHVMRICEDCGRPFLALRISKTNRCPNCYETYRKEANRLSQIMYRSRPKTDSVSSS